MVSVANPWFICGYHDLACFLGGFMCSKTIINFHKGMDSSAILVSFRYNIFNLEIVYVFVYSI